MKVNDKGRECPAWCRVDHEAEADSSCYGQERTVAAEPSTAGAEVSLSAYETEPEVSAWIYGIKYPGGLHGGRITVQGSLGAERLAEALEAAADLTKPPATPARRAGPRGESRRVARAGQGGGGRMKGSHPDSWGLRSGQRMPAEPKAQPLGPVNTHPGPDFDVPEQEAEAG